MEAFSATPTLPMFHRITLYGSRPPIPVTIPSVTGLKQGLSENINSGSTIIEIIHNIAGDAKTFYYGAGTTQLTGTPNPDPETWRGEFNYSTKRKRIDTGIKIDMAQPFFFNISFPYERKEGIKPTGVSTSSSRDASLELPEPVDYRTSGLRVEAGYSLKPFFASFSYAYGEFRNERMICSTTFPTAGRPDRYRFLRTTSFTSSTSRAVPSSRWTANSSPTSATKRRNPIRRASPISTARSIRESMTSWLPHIPSVPSKGGSITNTMTGIIHRPVIRSSAES